MNGTQLRALILLRWQLTRNQWRRNGELNAVLSAIMLVVVLGLSVVGAIGGLLGGCYGLAETSPEVNMAVWDLLVVLFLFLWAVGVMSELQRSEVFDLSRLLHLPVSLRGVFFLNYLASHFCFSLALLLPAMLALTVGAAAGGLPAMLLLLPAVLGFVFMITAWTYCLRGWLASLMVNKRRRRAIIIGATTAFILLCQLPNLFFNLRLNHDIANHPQTAAEMEEWIDKNQAERVQAMTILHRVHYYVPFLWLPLGARALAAGQVAPALLGALGMYALGGWGLLWAYRGTLRFYQGKENKRVLGTPPAAATAAAKRTANGKRYFLEWRLPAIPEDAAAMALASFRALTRAPEVKMALATNAILLPILMAGMFLRTPHALSLEIQRFAASGVIAATFLGVMQIMFNQFGFDRNGFRALVLLPSARHHILLGKNLALLPVAFTVFALYLGLLTVLLHLSALTVIFVTLDFCGAFWALSALGNLASVLAPYRIAAGSMKPTKMAGATVLLMFVSQLLLALAMLPVFLPAGLAMWCDHSHWLPGSVVALAAAAFLASAAALFYYWTLKPLGNLLQARERKILQVVTHDVE